MTIETRQPGRQSEMPHGRLVGRLAVARPMAIGQYGSRVEFMGKHRIVPLGLGLGFGLAL